MADTPSVFVRPTVALWVRRVVYGSALLFFALACFALGDVWDDAAAWQQGLAFALQEPLFFLFATVLLIQAYESTLIWHVAMATVAPFVALVHFQIGLETDPVSTWVFGLAAAGLGVLALLSIGAHIGKAKAEADHAERSSTDQA